MADPAYEDIIDEAIMFFRANCFFKNYEIEGSADKVIVFLTVFIQRCLFIAAGRYFAVLNE
jgi:actin related protein 2/3 complex, subunit 3